MFKATARNLVSIFETDEINEINNLLKLICSNLGKQSLNYAVTVKLFAGCETLNLDEIDSITEILGCKTEVIEIEESSLIELVKTVKECFAFEGNEGSYPNKEFIQSVQFKTILDDVLKKITNLFDAFSIFIFQLKDETHPFYPVYWDYAFFVKNKEKCYVLIGSSSD
jgi:hypothetical protein